MAKNVYGSGLNNVGSYQVSGKPFVTASTVSDGVEQQIEFPEVTNNITVKLDSATGEYRKILWVEPTEGIQTGVEDLSNSGIGGESTLTFSINAPNADEAHNVIADAPFADGGGNTYNSLQLSSSRAVYTSTIDFNNGDFVSPSASYSVSWWEKPIQSAGGTWTIWQWGNKAEPYVYGFRRLRNSSHLYYQSENTDGWISRWQHGAFELAQTFDSDGYSDDWYHFVFTLEAPPSGLEHTASMYRNGVLISSHESVLKKRSSTIDYLSQIDYTQGGSYPQFHIGETAAYSYGIYKDFILWDDILSADQALDLYQASASYSSLGFSPTSSTSGGELRIHYRSTGSLPNVETNKHYWTLDSQGESITMNVKSKEIYLSSDGGDVDYSLHADLTTIPSSRMYQHTGSGVDE